MPEVASSERTPWNIPPDALPQWRELAAVLASHGPAPCEEGDPEAWWPAGGRDPDPVAVSGCAGCPALSACLEYAVAADEREGLWGGLSRAERVALRKERKIPAPAPAGPRHGENSTYAAGCDCGLCRLAHSRYIARWRARQQYAETTRQTA